LEIGINIDPPNYVEIVLEDYRGIVAISRNVEELLWAAMEYLQEASKWIQRQFYKRWTANYQNLHSEQHSYVSILRPILHYDRNDATPYVCVWRMYWCIRLDRFVDMIDVKYMRFSNIASEDTIRDSNIFNGHQLVDCELTLVFKTYEKKRCKKCE